MYFDSKNKSDQDIEAKGTIKIHEFNQDDDDIEITVTCEKAGEFV
jgi:activator of HSP90 ATPase